MAGWHQRIDELQITDLVSMEYFPRSFSTKLPLQLPGVIHIFKHKISPCHYRPHSEGMGKVLFSQVYLSVYGGTPI